MQIIYIDRNVHMYAHISLIITLYIYGLLRTKKECSSPSTGAHQLREEEEEEEELFPREEEEEFFSREEEEESSRASLDLFKMIPSTFPGSFRRDFEILILNVGYDVESHTVLKTHFLLPPPLQMFFFSQQLFFFFFG